MRVTNPLAFAILAAASSSPAVFGFVVQRPNHSIGMRPPRAENTADFTALHMASEEASTPISFREAEILGLRLMQEGSYQDALVGTFFIKLFIYKFVMF
jgi:hypothetical protein